MQKARLIPGRVLYSGTQGPYLGRGRQIFQSDCNEDRWTSWAALPGGLSDRLVAGVPWVSRLLRKGIHHLAMTRVGSIAIAGKETFLAGSHGVMSLGPLHGSRPMSLCESGGVFYYGEYRSNPERSGIHVWKWKAGDLYWSPAWRFGEVRHVHGVFYDPYANAIWVTTGDKDSEAGIWRTDDGFESLHKVVGGSQQRRAVQLLFTREHVYFGSDAPDEENHIYRMERSGRNVERLAAVGSSVFYGCTVGESLFFSTAVEPSRVNTTRYAEVWRSDNGSDWYKFLEFKKDWLPMKYFQYGQVLFPSGPGDGRHLYCTPFATKGHGTTLAIDVGSTTGEFLEGLCN